MTDKEHAALVEENAALRRLVEQQADEIVSYQSEVGALRAALAEKQSLERSLRNDVEYWYRRARPRLARGASGDDSGGSPPSSGPAAP